MNQPIRRAAGLRGPVPLSSTLRLIAAACMLLALAAPAHTQTTVVLVRHAEKVDDSADAALSEAGLLRAQALAAALADAGVSAVHVTQRTRTRDTAAPLAARLGITPVVTATGGAVAEHAARIAALIRGHEPGTTVLVVGHSNTVPAIILALGGPAVGDIEDDEYDNLFVLLVSSAGARLIRGRY
jgi:phosphohistidine phosphatase SixA